MEGRGYPGLLPGPPSTSGPGRGPFKAVARVRIPLGAFSEVRRSSFQLARYVAPRASSPLGIPFRAMARLRRWLPLLAVVLLAAFCLGATAFACACAVDHPGQAIERAVGSASVATAPVIELWTMIVFVVGTPLVALLRRRVAFGRASPVDLQRFLF